MIAGRRATAQRALAILDAELKEKPFICGNNYTIADISLFAYAHLANEAELETAGLPAFEEWVARVRAQDRHLAEIHAYAIDPNAISELP